MSKEDVPSRFDTLITISVVVVSIALSLLIWRASIAASTASGDDRAGMIDLVKKQAALNENTRKLYEEKFYLREYELLQTRVNQLESSSDLVNQVEAKFLNIILPNLAKLSPLSTEPQYKNPDGTYNYEKRMVDLTNAFPEAKLEPQKSFNLANIRYQEQRWLMVAAVLMGLALFWTSLAEILNGKLKMGSYLIGVLSFLGTIAFVFIVELLMLVGRLGL